MYKINLNIKKLKPTADSADAKHNINKAHEIKIAESICAPLKIKKIYKLIQIISLNKIKFNKLGLKYKKPPKAKIHIKSIHSIVLNTIYIFY